jgi:hypothetical protein
LSRILKTLNQADINNADETGLFFKMLPDKALEFRETDCHDGKINKEITVMIYANTSGTNYHFGHWEAKLIRGFSSVSSPYQ